MDNSETYRIESREEPILLPEHRASEIAPENEVAPLSLPYSGATESPSAPDDHILRIEAPAPSSSPIRNVPAPPGPDIEIKAAETNLPVPVIVHAGADSGTSVRIHSTSGKRIHPRFDLPFSVDIEGASYPGTNLSLGGVGLASPSLSTGLGEVFRAAVRFSFPTHEIRVAANLAVVRLDNSQRAVAFQFLDLNVDTARIFQSITDKWASGDISNLDSVIAPNGSKQALSLTGGAIRSLRSLGLLMRYGVALGGAGLAAWLLGNILYDRWFSIAPEHAAVASDTLQIQAPVSGYFRERLPVGARLKVNDEIGVLAPIAPSAPRTEWQLRLSNLKIRLESQQAALERAQAASASVVRALTAERERARTEQRSLKDQIAGQHKTLDVIRADIKRGKVTSANLASEDARLSQLERLLVQSQTAEALLIEQLRSAELGLPLVLGRSAERAPAEVERDLRQTASEIQILEQTLATVPETTSLSSPCDCVLSVIRRDGEYVEAGAVLASLTPVQESNVAAQWQVDALVPHEQAQAIATGDPVEIRVGSAPEAMTGHVIVISYDASPKDRTGLPAQLVTSGRFARVTIAVATRNGQPAPDIGTPVQVRFQSALRSAIALPAFLTSFLNHEPEIAGIPETRSP